MPSMIKFRHFSHPVRTARSVRLLWLEHRRMRSALSHARFPSERDGLQSVTDGFASRVDAAGDDTVLLERICAAYA